jgi:hypothetical protein
VDGKGYRRRNTGDLAFDPALYQLVMATGSLLDRLLCTQHARGQGADPDGVDAGDGEDAGAGGAGWSGGAGGVRRGT